MTEKEKCVCSKEDKIDAMHDMITEMKHNMDVALIEIKTTIKPLKDNGQPGLITRFVRAEGKFGLFTYIFSLLITVMFALMGWLFTMIDK